MARKRANKTTKKVSKTVKENPMLEGKVPPLSEMETQYFKELVNASNVYAKLLKQQAQFEYIIKQLEEKRTKIQKGEIPMPIQMTLIPKLMTYNETDKKKILADIDEYITSYKNSIKGIQGQMEHKHDEYVESAIRNREFFNRRYADKKAKYIVPDRKMIDDEEDLFAADFNKLVEESEEGKKLQEEFKKAKIEAAKKNVARKKKTDKEE